jgi:Pyruvate/2-oxoacid:ferredoxin oxidoreductase gamma subunit
MEVVAYLYNSDTGSDTVQTVLERLEDRDATVTRIDLTTAQEPADARREAMLMVGTATRVGAKPDAIFDDEGTPDFSPGVLITEEAKGRRDLHVGEEALEVL